MEYKNYNPRAAALAQARYMQVPVSAAVNEAVKLTRTFKKASASGLVNAVLRKACNYDLETARFRNETQRLMVLGSAGQDVAEFLRTHYPEEALGPAAPETAAAALCPGSAARLTMTNSPGAASWKLLAAAA